jgi:hypothetical protein
MLKAQELKLLKLVNIKDKVLKDILIINFCQRSLESDSKEPVLNKNNYSIKLMDYKSE